MRPSARTCQKGNHKILRWLTDPVPNGVGGEAPLRCQDLVKQLGLVGGEKGGPAAEQDVHDDT